MHTQEIIDIIDDYLVSSGKRYIGLRAANDLLISKGKPDLNLKAILVKNEISHAYQTETKPRQWRIPYSDPNNFREKRNEFLKTQPKSNLKKIDATTGNFTLKHVLILLITGLFFYFLLFDDNSNDNSYSASNVGRYYINSQAFATYNKNDFDEMFDCVVYNDTKALQEMLEFGKIAVLEKGTEVYLVEAHLGYDVVRENGSTQTYWIPTERLSKQ